MEVIDVGKIKVENILRDLIDGNKLSYLTNAGNVACFLLAHQMLSPQVFTEVVKNSDTIDATTRDYVDFIVFYGNQEVILEKQKFRTQENLMFQIQGVSKLGNQSRVYPLAPPNLSDDVRFNRDLGDFIRYNFNAVNESVLSHKMTKATSVLLDIYDLSEEILPCVLFVNPSAPKQDFFYVNFDEENPKIGLYRQVLQPLSIEIRRINSFQKSIEIIQEEKLNNVKFIKQYNRIEEQLKLLYSKKEKIENEINEIKDNSYRDIEKISVEESRFVSYVDILRKEKFKGIEKFEQKIELEDDPNSVNRLNILIDKTRYMKVEDVKFEKAIKRVLLAFELEMGLKKRLLKEAVSNLNEVEFSLSATENKLKELKVSYDKAILINESIDERITSVHSDYEAHFPIIANRNTASFQLSVFNHLKSVFIKESVSSETSNNSLVSKYDLFICYSSEDRFGVIDPLIKVLSNHQVSYLIVRAEIG